ncbi:MAG: isopeptide-forming domain-containing fimbrial protein [Oscillospiraceae bacterium]|nr:isopeptide-forming domain-containing fimbrial protein [Oscillospiraceae bacterium]
MKNTKRIAAMIAALAMAAMAVPGAMLSTNAAPPPDSTTGTQVTVPNVDVLTKAGEGTQTNTINITNPDGAIHTYVAHQIFKGDFGEGTLNNIVWGDGVNETAILDALHNASATEGHALFGLFPATIDTAKEVAEVLGSKTGEAPNETAVFANDSDKAQAFAAIVGENLTETTSGSVNGDVISGLADGYYLIMDTADPLNPDGDGDSRPDNDNSGARTRFIVKVAGGGDQSITADAKHAAPTVDKQVQDEVADKDPDADDDGWGETADHAINEVFQFKLTATLPPDSNFAAYDSYMLVFNDSWNPGVTYKGNPTVAVNGTEIAAYDLVLDTENRKLTITIDDLKPYDADLTDGAVVTVTYDACLNENAAVETVNQDAVPVGYENVNKVKLQYSNNPNAGGEGNLGETPEDYVWVFTYEVDNTKVDENNAPLPGAGFTLYADPAKTIAIKLKDNGDGTYTVADQNATTGTITEMMSQTGTGKFNIKGLDAGTYYLSETTVPAGYNKYDDIITIAIGATHQENEGAITASLDLTIDPEENTIKNEKGSALPSTGGLGTTLFVVGGGLTAMAAGIYLISKKRTQNVQ